MLESVRHLDQVAREWNINAEDVLLIALNASGARSPLAKPLDNRVHCRASPTASAGRSAVSVWGC